MTVLGASWVCLGISSLTSVPGSRTALLGVFLLAIAVVLTTMGVAAAKARPLVFAVAMLAVARYALTGTYEIAGGSGLQHAAGWLGVPIIAISLYGGTAFLLEETTQRTILPIGRRHGALTAMQADFDDQIENLGREAGVRPQL
jgi:succinate-acetate transporter protein